VGVLIFSVVAHAGLFPDSNITPGQLSKIFAAPGQRGIVAVGRLAGSGSRQAFDANYVTSNPSVAGNCPPPNGKAVSFTACTEGSTADLLNFVNETPNAIGYAEVSGPLSSYPNISVLGINKAMPTPDDVASGTYKFWVVEHLYTSSAPTPPALAFLTFLSGYDQPELLHDYVPCADVVEKLLTTCQQGLR
jgi:ABC-type phosphate transport system substrate-binding protein